MLRRSSSTVSFDKSFYSYETGFGDLKNDFFLGKFVFHLFFYLSIILTIKPFTNESIHLSIHPSNHPFIHPPIKPSIHSSTHQTIHPLQKNNTGLKNLAFLTSTRSYGLYIHLEAFDGNTAWADYKSFRISASPDYRLYV